MKNRILIAGLALFAGLGGVGGVANAQNSAPQLFGRVILAPTFDTSHLSLFSQNDFFYGTSRSAAMGGAFTSLGADLSSININPAGLGMYQSSDWGITQALSINNMATSAKNMGTNALTSGGNRVSYGLNNVGMAYNLFNSSGALTSLTFGFSYNRTANFNAHSSVATTGEHTSITDLFREQLVFIANDGVSIGDLKSNSAFENPDIFIEDWGAVLGLHSGLVTENGGVFTSTPTGRPSSFFRSITRGGIYEYDFSLGANITNILYLGATLGATHIDYREDNSYGEEYDNGAMEYRQNTRISGTGLTAKLGVTVRPLPALRIGVAFHLPTWYSVDKSYNSTIESGNVKANSGNPLVSKLRFTTAPRLLAGISGIIADRVIVALDYDLAWYNMIYENKNNETDTQKSKTESDGLYKPAHSLRAGAEMRVSDIISVRAGGGYKFDFMKDRHFLAYSIPAPKSGWHVSGGLGFNVGRNGYIDLTYVFNRQNYTDYDYYFFDNGVNTISQYDEVDGAPQKRAYSQHRNHHMITLTLGSRF